MKKIVSFFGERSDIYRKLNAKAADYALEKGMEYLWLPQEPFQQQTIIAALQEADVGIIDVEPYGEEIFSSIKGRIDLLIRFGSGYDKVDLDAASRHGIPVARTTGANTMGVAEMALTLLLAARRLISTNMNCVKGGKWVKHVVNETVGSTVGILGFGAIGSALAKLLRGLNCEVIAYDPNGDTSVASALGVRLVDVNELFTSADAISIHMPYLEETHHFVDEIRLNQMKKDAVIVNTSRGGIVDEEALYEALKSGQIRAAALDVFVQEPLATNAKLLELENIILTPHVSSQTEESLWRIYEMAIDIAADFYAGREVRHILNPQYRAVFDVGG